MHHLMCYLENSFIRFKQIDDGFQAVFVRMFEDVCSFVRNSYIIFWLKCFFYRHFTYRHITYEIPKILIKLILLSYLLYFEVNRSSLSKEYHSNMLYFHTNTK